MSIVEEGAVSAVYRIILGFEVTAWSQGCHVQRVIAEGGRDSMLAAQRLLGGVVTTRFPRLAFVNRRGEMS